VSIAHDVDRPLSFQFRLDVKRNQVSLLQRVSEAGLLDIALMKENVLPSFYGDEPISFGAIKEFYCACHASTLSVDRKTESPGKRAGADT
jgi:hypothetical protein